MSELPKGWEITTLGSLGTWSSGGTPSRKHLEYYGGSIPWVKTGDLQDSYIELTEEFLTDVGLKNSSAKLFHAGTLLLAMFGATIGRTGLLKIDAATNQACAALIADGLTKDLIPFLWWLLIHKADEFKSIGQGGSQPNISQTLIKQFPTALLPFNEQCRIIAKLDSLFARSRRTREELERIPKLCDRYRQAILAAACSGRLTADWREQNPDLESASELLKRIWKEKLKKHEEPYSQNISTRVRKPKQPVFQDVEDYEIHSWKYTTLETISEEIVDCPHSTPKWTDSGFLCVRTTQFEPFKLRLGNIRYVSKETFEERILRLKPKAGDVLYSREGGILGIACQIPPGLEVGCVANTF